MRLIDLAAVYVVVGVACAVVLARRGAKPNVLDAALTAVLWPVYVPVVVAPPRPPVATGEIAELAEAVRSVSDPSLAPVLPTPGDLDRLARAITALGARADELRTCLAREALDEARAAEAYERARGNGGAAEENARRVLESVRRLAALHAEAIRDRDDLLALARRLRLQVTVLRFAGTPPEGVADAVRDVLVRVESVEEVLRAA